MRIKKAVAIMLVNIMMLSATASAIQITERTECSIFPESSLEIYNHTQSIWGIGHEIVLYNSNEMVLNPNPGEREIEETNGEESIFFSNCSASTHPGEPALPVRHYRLLLPPGTIVSSVTIKANYSSEIVTGEYWYEPTPFPVSYSMTGQDITLGNGVSDIYTKDTFWPPEIFDYEPVHMMRNAAILDLSYYTLQFNPVSKEIREQRNVSVKISWNVSTEDNRDFLTYDFLSGMKEDIDDFNLVASEYRSVEGLSDSTLAYSNATYLIVTTNDILSNSTALDEFGDFIESRGFAFDGITEDDYGSAVGEQRVFNIRQWIFENYVSRSIKYVLLIGDPTPYNKEAPGNAVGDIPMLLCWPRHNAAYYTEYPDSATDYIYADLTGNWDLDGDGYYGEYSDDGGTGGVDFYPEVFVGRIPVYDGDYAALDTILRNTIDFPHKSGPWKDNILEPMSISNYANEDSGGSQRTDGLDVPEYVFNNIANPLNMQDTVMYERAGRDAVPTTSFHYSMGISTENFSSEFNKGQGAVFWWAHGNWYGAYRKYWSSDDGDGIPESAEMTWSTFINSYGLDNLDESHPAFFYQSSCLNGQPEEHRNLGYALLKEGVAISTVSASNISWYNIGTWSPNQDLSDNTGIGYYYMYNLLRNGQSDGEALFNAKAAGGNAWEGESWMNKMDFNLYGDPEMDYCPYKFDIPVHIGWNLISYPLDVKDDVETVLNDDVVWDYAQTYSPTDTGDHWKTHFIGRTLNDLSVVDNKGGLWLHVTDVGDGYISVNRAEIANYQIFDNDSVVYVTDGTERAPWGFYLPNSYIVDVPSGVIDESVPNHGFLKILVAGDGVFNATDLGWFWFDNVTGYVNFNNTDWDDPLNNYDITEFYAFYTYKTSRDVPRNTAITLHSGWNLVGYPSSTSVVMDAAGLPSSVTKIGNYDSGAVYLVSEVSDWSASSFVPGSGYWLYSSADTTWFVGY